jgi:asparagine synthase (glutamine-hydrolysing)
LREFVHAGIEQTLARYPGLFNRDGVKAHADAMLDGRKSVDFSLWRIISLGIWGQVFGVTA